MDMLNYVLAWALGPTEMIIIALVLLLLFGGKKIPELMKGLGKGMKEFKDASKGDEKGSSEQKIED
jgi:sec-independent protein translocase protein TatA